MSKLALVFLFLLLSSSLCDPCPTIPSEDSGATVTTCKDIPVPPTYYKCCLLTYTLPEEAESKTCYALTEEQAGDYQIVYNGLQRAHPGSRGNIVCDGDSEDDDKCPTAPGSDSEASVDKCKDIPVPSTHAKCCLLTYTLKGKSEAKTCLALTTEEANNYQSVLTSLQSKYEGSTGAISCYGDRTKGEENDDDEDSSSFVKLSLLSLLLLLL